MIAHLSAVQLVFLTNVQILIFFYDLLAHFEVGSTLVNTNVSLLHHVTVTPLHPLQHGHNSRGRTGRAAFVPGLNADHGLWLGGEEEALIEVGDAG